MKLFSHPRIRMSWRQLTLPAWCAGYLNGYLGITSPLVSQTDHVEDISPTKSLKNIVLHKKDYKTSIMALRFGEQNKEPKKGSGMSMKTSRRIPNIGKKIEPVFLT